MKTGDKVIFIGATKEQIQWGGNDDPNKYLKEGDISQIEKVEVHSWHTKIYLVGIPGKFNSVSFKLKPDYISDDIKKVSQTDLITALRDLKRKQKEERRQDQIAINKALGKGFTVKGKLS